MGKKFQSVDRLTNQALENMTYHPTRRAGVMAALALVGKQVLDEARKRQPLTPKSPRGDAAFE